MTSMDRSNRQSWLLTGILVAAVAVIAVLLVVGFAKVDDASQRTAHAAQRQQQATQAEQKREACFQSWANATAHRTDTVSRASNARVDSLDHLLDVRSDYSADAPQSKKAIRQAAAAGDKYERIVRNNPPVPPLKVFCASRHERPPGNEPPPSSSPRPSSFQSSSRASSRSPVTTAGARTTRAAPASSLTVRTTPAGSLSSARTSATPTPTRKAAPTVAPTVTPHPLRSLVCGVLGLVTTSCPTETP